MHAKVEIIDFKASHRRGIGGSSAAAVCGVSRHRTKHEVLMALKGAKDIEQTDAMWLGKQLEDDMHRFYERKTGKVVYSPGDDVLYIHPTYEWLVCHPDGFAHDGPREVVKYAKDPKGTLLEFKIAGFHNRAEWGDPAFCQVPQEYLCQCYHNMLVCGVQKCELVVLLGTELEIYPIELDKNLAASMFRKEQDFWTRHVVGNEPLEADGSEGCRDYLTWLHPQHKEPLAWAEGDAARDINLLAGQLEIYDAAKLNCDELKNKIRAHIGDREGLRTERMICTWKANVKGVKSFRTELVDVAEGVA